MYDTRGKATLDLLTLDDEDPRIMEHIVARHPRDHTKRRTLARDDITAIEPLLVPVWRDGRPALSESSIAELRLRREANVQRLDAGVRRLINPHIYHVALTERLWGLKQQLIAAVQALDR